MMRKIVTPVVGALFVGALLAAAANAGVLSVSGTIRAPNGVGMAGALAELVPMPSVYDWGSGLLAGRPLPPPAATAETDAAGRFTLAAPRPGFWLVVLRAPGFVPMSYDSLALVEPAELPPAVLTADAGARVRVVDQTGKAVPGAWLYVTSQNPRLWAGSRPWTALSRFAVADENGMADVPRAAAERLTVRALAPGRRMTQRSGITNETATLRLRAAESCRLRLRRADGESAAAVLVRIGNSALPVALSADDGTASFPWDPAGLRLRLLAATGHRHELELAPGNETCSEPLDVVLPEPVWLAGRTVDLETSLPLAGALVWPVHEPGLARLTDERGAYSVPAPATPRWRLRAVAAGYLGTGHEAVYRPGSPPRAPALALEPAAAMSGEVVDAAGSAVAGALVHAVPRTSFQARGFFSGPPPRRQVTSDADGSFHVRGLRAGEEYELRAAHQDFATARRIVTGLKPRRTRGGLRLVLNRGRALVGRAVNPDDVPVAGVLVELTRADGRRLGPRRGERPPGPLSGLAGGDGAFEVNHVPAGTFDVVLTRDGYVPTVVRGAVMPAGEGGSVDLGLIRLAPGVAVEGRVVDRMEQPIAGVEVARLADSRELQNLRASENHSRLAAAATSDGDGRFVVNGLGRGEQVHLALRHPDYMPAWLEGVEAPTEEDVIVVLEAAARIRGRVVDGSGRPIVGADVTAHTIPEAALEGTSREIFARLAAATRTDPAGRFKLSVAPGEAWAAASAQGYLNGRGENLHLQEGEEMDGVEIVLERGAVVHGTVRAADGKPLPGARVAIGPGADVTDADGHYRVDGAPIGPGTVLVDLPGHGRLRQKAEIRSGEQTLDLVMESGTDVEGRVVDQAGGGVEGARVHLAWSHSRPTSTLSDEHGFFRFASMPSGGYELNVAKQGYARADHTFVLGEEPLTDLVVRLHPGVRVVGRLLGLAAGDAAGVEVIARDSSQTDVRGLVLADGTYEITGLAPGDWEIRAAADDGRRQANARRRLEDGDVTVSVDLDLGTGFTLSGRVFHDGEPLAGASLTLRGHDVAVARSVAVDHRGSFSVENLEAGSYRLQVTESRQFVNHSEEVVIDGDRDLLVELETSRLAGWIFDATDGRPIADAMILVDRRSEERDETAFRVGVPSASDGTFLVPRVTSGRFRVRVQKKGFETVTEEILIAAGESREDLEFALRPASGLVVAPRMSTGGLPRTVTVGVVDPTGAVRFLDWGFLDAEGQAHLRSLPSGDWQLVVTAPEASLTFVRARIPAEEPLVVVLEPASRLSVHVPALAASNEVAELAVYDAGGRSWRDLSGADDQLQERWRVVGGTARLETLAPGTWSLEVRAADGRRWTGSVTVAAGAQAEVQLNPWLD